ncbi:hypothetical protein ANANG_G00168030, partial [Anguilla anguilla]
ARERKRQKRRCSSSSGSQRRTDSLELQYRFLLRERGHGGALLRENEIAHHAPRLAFLFPLLLSHTYALLRCG